MVPVTIAAVLAMILATVPNETSIARTTEAPRGRLPNVIVVLTDDQRADSLRHMTTLRDRVMGKGVTFDRGFVVDPLCCPSRTSLLRGQASHTTGIWSLSGRYGGWAGVHRRGLERSTLATWLNSAGYRTGLVGKYLNGYNDLGYVPPGWDVWRGLGTPRYHGFTVSEDGRAREWPDRAYNTTVMTRYAERFIRSTQRRTPLFLFLNYIAPHEPTIPEAKYDDDDARCDSERRDREPAFNEANVGDKPDYIAHRAPLSRDEVREYGVRRPQDACRTLLSVDDGLGVLLDALAETGRLDTTLLIYTSDNGILDGEHRHREKKVPYEEAIRVPLVVRYDPLTAGDARRDRRMVLNIDIAPTITDLVGLSVRPGCPDPRYGECDGTFDGRSFLGLLDGSTRRWRRAFLVEHYDDPSIEGIPTYCAVRTTEHKFVRYRTGEEELYDLRRDPHELTNVLVAGGLTPAERELRARMRAKLFGPRGLCSPRPPGLSPPG
jgi:arylsulfatase A-like enzyme